MCHSTFMWHWVTTACLLVHQRIHNLWLCIAFQPHHQRGNICGPSKSINATKEHRDEITTALVAVLEAGINVRNDVKPFDSELGQVAERFRDYLKPSHLMAICDVKMKQTFSQSTFVSRSYAVKMWMFCICLQVNKQQDLLVLLKFGLMSNNNILSIKDIDRLPQEGTMNQSSAYKPVTANCSAKDDTTSYISSPVATNKRAVSPAQNRALRAVKPKQDSNTAKRKRSVAGRQPVSGGGNQIALDSTSRVCWLMFCCWQLPNKSWYLPRYRSRFEKRIYKERRAAWLDRCKLHYCILADAVAAPWLILLFACRCLATLSMSGTRASWPPFSRTSFKGGGP